MSALEISTGPILDPVSARRKTGLCWKSGCVRLDMGLGARSIVRVPDGTDDVPSNSPEICRYATSLWRLYAKV